MFSILLTAVCNFEISALASFHNISNFLIIDYFFTLRYQSRFTVKSCFKTFTEFIVKRFTVKSCFKT